MEPPSVVPDELLERMIETIATPFPNQGSEANADVHGAAGTFVPTRNVLRDAIDAVFWAMQTREESRPAITRVSFQQVRPPACALAPRPLSVSELAKLSPVMDMSTSWLIANEEGALVGIGPRAHYAAAVAGTPRGHLVMSIGDRVLAILEGRRWHWVNGDRMRVTTLLGSTFTAGELPDKLIRGSLVIDLATQARNAGRGAAFVMIEGTNTDGLVWPPKYPVTRFDTAGEGIALWDAWRADPFPVDFNSWSGQEARRHKREGSERLRKLAATLIAAVGGIDGATVMSLPTMALLGFGAKIDRPDDDVTVRVLELPIEAPSIRTALVEKKKRDLGGMRHQSAARLVHHNREAAVVTVSQDGSITLFGWSSAEGSGIVVRGIDRYVAAE